MQKIIVEQGGVAKELNVQTNYSTNGWTLLLVNVADGANRVVQKVADLVGGTGTKPSGIINKYLGASGLVSNIADATNIKGADGTGSEITVNGVAAVDGNITITYQDVGADESGAAAVAEQNANDYADGILISANSYTNEVAATKLDAADYVQHFKGKYTTLLALQTAYPTATEGDYAIVDGGIGVDAKQYIWDSTDNQWIEAAITPASTTDEVAEGSTNLYFTTGRVRDVVLSGLSLLTGGAIAATDSILTAFGKLQKQISDLSTSLSNYLTTSSASSTYATIANQRYQFVVDAGATYTTPASVVTENGCTIVELSNASLTSITIDTNTGTGKTSGDSVHISITGAYTAQVLVASGVTLQGTLTFSRQYQTKTLVYKGSNVWRVIG